LGSLVAFLVQDLYFLMQYNRKVGWSQ